MHRIDTSTAQIDKFGLGKNGFTNGDPATGRRATDLNSDMWDAVQEEICNVIEKSGLKLDKDQHDQMYKSIVQLITNAVPDALLRKNNLSDLTDAAIARSNLRLGNSAVMNTGNTVGTVAAGDDSRIVNALQKDRNLSELNNPSTALKNIGGFPAAGGKVGSAGVDSTGDIVANECNIILKAGKDGAAYYFQNQTRQNVARISSDDYGNVSVYGLNGGDSLKTGGPIYASNARFNIDGNIQGSAWNGWLSDYIGRLKNTYGNGWFKDSSTGIIIQWGFMSSSSSVTSFGRYNIDFPNQSLVVVATLGVNLSPGSTVYASVSNTQGFDYKTSGSGIGFGWIAIGR